MGCVHSHSHVPMPARQNNVFKVSNVDYEGTAVTDGLLEITDQELVLHETETEPIRWPLSSLRRYGYDLDYFSFESGRRCATGPGIFAFKCEQAEVLFNLLQERIQNSDNSGTGGTRLPSRGFTIDRSIHHPPLRSMPRLHSPRSSLPTMPAPPPPPLSPGSSSAEAHLVFPQSRTGMMASRQNSAPSTGRLPLRSLSRFPLTRREYVNTEVLNSGADDYMHPVSTKVIEPILSLLDDDSPVCILQYADLDLHTGSKVSSPSHIHYENIENCQDLPTGTCHVFRDQSVEGATGYDETMEEDYIYSTSIRPGMFKRAMSSCSNGSTFHNGFSCLPEGPGHGYTTIDFTKTAAINAKNSVDEEGVRKTRHNSNIEELHGHL